MRRRFLITMLVGVSCLGCRSLFAARLGMTEKEWLQRTIFASPVMANDNVEIWKSHSSYYYFEEGKLKSIDQGQMAEQQYHMEVKHKAAAGPGK